MKIAGILIWLFVSGCAGSVWVVPVKNNTGSAGKAWGSEERGVHFFAPAPYVWITTAAPSEQVNIPETSKTKNAQRGKDTTSTRVEHGITAAAAPGYSMQIVFLPDPSREYAVQWKPGFFGSITPKFNLENGWNLVAFESTINSGVTASLSLSGQAEVTRTTAAIAETFQPGLYALKYDPEKKLWRLGDRVFP